jgi:hypothetical protein
VILGEVPQTLRTVIRTMPRVHSRGRVSR